MPSSVAGTEEGFVLHPSIMDGALQASIGMGAGEPESKATPKLSLPFALQEMEIYCALARRGTGSIWAIIQYSKDNTATDKVRKLDIDICDGQGQVCVRMKGYSSRVLEGGTSETGATVTSGGILLEPVWKDHTVVNINTDTKYPRIYPATGDTL